MWSAKLRSQARIRISGLGTVLTALYAAGGLTNRANLRRLEVRRNDKTVSTFDLYDYLLSGDKRDDIRLETGDVVFVPLHGPRIQVTGAVRRPAIFEMKPGETLSDLVAAAGGFLPDAQLRRLAVYRILPAAERGPGPFPRAVVDVPMPIPPPPGDPNPTLPAGREFSGVIVPSIGLEDGDSVAVDSLPPLSGTLFVAISGMVTKPGQYPWRDGMTMRDLVLLARGPKVGADLQEAGDRAHASRSLARPACPGSSGFRWTRRTCSSGTRPDGTSDRRASLHPPAVRQTCRFNRMTMF